MCKNNLYGVSASARALTVCAGQRCSISHAVRHAKPTVVSVSLRYDPANLVLEVTDHGSGIAHPEAARRDGFGLSNMRARGEEEIAPRIV